MEMSMQQENSDIKSISGERRFENSGVRPGGSGSCLYDLFCCETPSLNSQSQREQWMLYGPQERLDNLMRQAGNKFCADCGSSDPKWVSSSLGVFICIKCSGIHRSLGVHISKVLSLNLDDWTDEQVDALVNLGGNTVINKKYEACLPSYIKKPKPTSSIEERSDFIRRKYELQQFVDSEENLTCPFIPSHARSSSSSHSSSSYNNPPQDKKRYDKQTTKNRIGLSFRNSWGRKESESKSTKKSNSLIVYDKDSFKTDDFMGEAEIDIQPLVSAAKAYEKSSINESMQLGKWVASGDNTLVKDGIISLEEGKVRQEISLRLQNVERGVLEIELECVPLTQ
ncbi:probable ADP-ribosylation factor GTPase-activating protein AGD11 isoform X4 [Cicer arietinum]|uniref:Probable ADP-ribosylation factor GTPase-activating protein AGD11 isoform X4 n=1 Tax=Cicer arietinum TaxID=3827 RepID=A0A3Q7XRA0_CICAR|nr:probable ADP-ribosylation factor GTPase-activating protein AGD11 isoform X4 [Cicer arietinum]